jgi:hypothetical protein
LMRSHSVSACSPFPLMPVSDTFMLTKAAPEDPATVCEAF